MAYAASSTGYGRNTGKRWRHEDVVRLRDLARRGAPLRLIGLKLGRPDSAIRAKAADLGLTIGTGPTMVAPEPVRTLTRTTVSNSPSRRSSGVGQPDLFVRA